MKVRWLSKRIPTVFPLTLDIHQVRAIVSATGNSVTQYNLAHGHAPGV